MLYEVKGDSANEKLQALKENCVTSLRLIEDRSIPQDGLAEAISQTDSDRQERKRRRALRRQEVVEIDSGDETMKDVQERVERKILKLTQKRNVSQIYLKDEWKGKLHKATVEEISTGRILGDSNTPEQINCICWVNRPTPKRQDFLKCTRCKSLQHKTCILSNGRFPLLPYLCPGCQLKDLDPLKTPVLTLLKPFKVPTIFGNNAQRFKLLQFCKREFFMPEELERYLLQKHQVLFTEIRCVQLDPCEREEDGYAKNFKHQWPKKGYYSFNYKEGKEFVLPGESEFYRKDNQSVSPNPMTLEGIGLERVRREDLIFDISAQITPGPNFVELAKFDEPRNYACAIYVTKLINIYDMSHYLRNYHVESFLESYERLKNHISSVKYFKEEKVNVRCPISQSRLKLPARGEKCTHLQCFEAENYLWMNQHCKRWLCPICMKPAYHLTIDQLMLQVIKKVNYLYPSDLGLENLPNKKEVVETLLTELNAHRKHDEQEPPVLDKNDLDYVTVNVDMTIQVGVRTYIPNPELDADSKNYLIEYNIKDNRLLGMAIENEKLIKGLQKQIRMNLGRLKEGFKSQFPVERHELEIIKIAPESYTEEIEEITANCEDIQQVRKRRRLDKQQPSKDFATDCIEILE
ncbi:hypothetical protein FGO68_gene14071 [Halteria grandinella]|uniref:SP-RING-type domain-containing protein n=1 Tax=Halteria grandinella TaxID=5974 RepID=A0A8J8NW12_HALGN|nr:hypothetical protein FGO68_gene14071 [Halteria grandinella]